jgi:hypothetical protein
MKRPPRQLPEQPKEIVTAAYQAASRGKFSLFRRRTDKALRVQLAKARAKIAAADRHVHKILVAIEGRHDAQAAKSRKTLRGLLRINRLVRLGLSVSSMRRDIRNSQPRGRSLATIKVTRQIVRGRIARVYLRVTLKDGTMIRESESLVLHGGRWYFR